MDKKELVWSFIKDREYFPMKFKEIAKAMEVPEDEVEILGLILDELTFEHKIIKDFDGRYFDSETNGYIFGTFSYSGRGYGFLRSDDGKGDVFIPPDKTLSALSGDKVFVKLMSGRGGINPEGEVYRIVERVNKTVVGTVQINRKLVFVIPDNDKLGTDIFITNKGTTKYKNNMKVVVRINKWPNRERNASGDIIEVLGYAGENEAEVLSVIKDNSIRYIFNRATIEEAEKKKITVLYDVAKTLEHPYYISISAAVSLGLNKGTSIGGFYHLTEEELGSLQAKYDVNVVTQYLNVNNKKVPTTQPSVSDKELDDYELRIIDDLYASLADFEDYYKFFGFQNMRDASPEEILNSSVMKELERILNKGKDCENYIAINLLEFLEGFKN